MVNCCLLILKPPGFFKPPSALPAPGTLEAVQGLGLPCYPARHANIGRSPHFPVQQCSMPAPRHARVPARAVCAALQVTWTCKVQDLALEQQNRVDIKRLSTQHRAQ